MVDTMKWGQPYGALLASAVGMMSSLVAMFLGTMPLFLAPVSADLGWDRATLPSLLMAVLLLSGLLHPLVGRLIDRFGSRPVGLVGTALWGCGLCLMSQMGSSFAYRILVIACLGVGGGVAGHLVYARVIGQWFSRGRGLLMGAVLGTAPAISQAISAPIISTVIRTAGWRTAYLSLGLFVLCVTLVLNLVFLREPAAAGRRVAASAGTVSGETTRSAIFTSRFWILTLLLSLNTATYNSVFQHSVAMITLKGLPPAVGTAFISIAGLAGLLSPLFAGIALDKFRTPRLATLPFMVMLVIGICIMRQVVDSVSVLVAAVLLGLSVGVGPVVQPFVLYRYFGRRAQSEIFGASMIGIIVGAGCGPVLLGSLFDRSGSYSGGLIVMAAFAMVTVVLAALLPGYKYETSANKGIPQPAEHARDYA